MTAPIIPVIPPPSGLVLSFSGGTINSNGVYTPQIGNGGSALELTNSTDYSAASWFSNITASITSFTASFDYQASGPTGGTADGFAFVLQDSSAGTFALGGAGGSLGYGSALSIGGGTVISPSAAVEFNLYSGHTQGTNFATDGITGDYGSTGHYNSTGNVAFWNGDAMQVQLTYNGNILTETLTDLVNDATYSASYTRQSCADPRLRCRLCWLHSREWWGNLDTDDKQFHLFGRHVHFAGWRGWQPDQFGAG